MSPHRRRTAPVNYDLWIAVAVVLVAMGLAGRALTVFV